MNAKRISASLIKAKKKKKPLQIHLLDTSSAHVAKPVLACLYKVWYYSVVLCYGTESLMSLIGNTLRTQFYRCMCWVMFLKNTRGISRKSGLRKLCEILIQVLASQQCVWSMLRPPCPWIMKQKVKVLKISVADSTVIDQVISVWFWFKEINAILNCCLYTEGLNEATLRTLYPSVVTWGRYRDEKTSKRGNHV